MRHAQTLVPEGINLSDKLMRQQARPEDPAVRAPTRRPGGTSRTYQDSILGVIADIEFPKDGAGLAPRPAWTSPATSANCSRTSRSCCNRACRRTRRSPRRCRPRSCSRTRRRCCTSSSSSWSSTSASATSSSAGRTARSSAAPAICARSRRELRTVPAESLAYHGERNHFSNWLKARTEFALAYRLRPRKVSDFASIEDLRARPDRRHSRLSPPPDAAASSPTSIARRSIRSRASAGIGSGSLGGKGRSLAFLNFLIEEYELGIAIPRRVEIGVPPAVVLGTDVFDRVLDAGDLRAAALASTDDGALLERFRATPLPGGRARRRWRRTSTSRATRWPCGRRACSRTRRISRLPACTKP